jgi:CheY-like chemotaxis protein
VLALTAHSDPADIERFTAAGFAGHVAKPIVDAEAFFAEIDRHLSS